MAAKAATAVRRIFSAAAARVLRRGAAAQRGIIMLDMVIAVALLALLILLVLPSLPQGTSAARLGGYASEVAAVLKADRSAAARTRGEVSTRINLAERRVVSGSASRAVSLPQDVTLDVVASDACRTPGNELAIVFGPDGRTCGAVISLARGNLNWRVRVNWLTGFIDVVPPNRQG
jgi:general secretion pathway protein H